MSGYGFMDQILYKYRGLENFKFFLDILLNNRLYASEYENMNDPMEGIFYYPTGAFDKSILEKIANDKMKYKICSVTKVNNNELMWSHYANGHTCVAIGISIDRTKYDIVSVQYDGLSFIENQNLHFQTAREILSHKLEVWQYEQEERILVSRQNYVKIIVKEIIFGRRTSTSDKKLIKNLIQKMNLNIQIMEANEIMEN